MSVVTVQSYRKAVASSTAYYDAVVADGATAYWSLDEASGNFTDAIGGHTMTVSDVTYSASALMTTDGGAAATFDGTNDYATATGHADLFPAAGQDFSIECWIKAPDKVQSGPLVYMRNATTPFPQIGLFVGYVGGGGSFVTGRQISMGVTDSSTRRRFYRTTNDIIPVGSPVTFYLVGVYDNTNDAIKIYVDGTEESLTLSYTLNAFPDGGGAASTDMHIGWNSLTEYYEGDLDAVAVYDGVALSSSQISDHYTKGT